MLLASFGSYGLLLLYGLSALNDIVSLHLLPK